MKAAYILRFLVVFTIWIINISCNKKQVETKVNEQVKYTPIDSQLYDQILALDEQLFRAFNQRDLEGVKNMFSPALEFFHDEGGLMSFEQNLAGIQNLLTGETLVKRKLVENSSEVYPIPNYGAIQIGAHHFYNQRPGEKEMLMGTYKFTHIWQQQNDQWQITRVISYGH